MSDHTPGPWRLGLDDSTPHRYWVAGPDDTDNVVAFVVTRHPGGCGPLTPEDAANGNLISASPDILNAVAGQHSSCGRTQTLIELLIELQNEAHMRKHWTLATRLDSHIGRLRAAVAKAGGAAGPSCNRPVTAEDRRP